MSNSQFNSDIELRARLDEIPCIYDIINEEYPTTEYLVDHGFSPAEISTENIMDIPLSPIRVDWPETVEEINTVNDTMPVSLSSGPRKKRFRKVGKVPRKKLAKKVRFAPTAKKVPRYPIGKKEIKVKKEKTVPKFYVGNKPKISLSEAEKLKLKKAYYHNNEPVNDAGDFTLFHGKNGCFYAVKNAEETYLIPFHKGQKSYVFSWCGGVERANKIKDWVKPEAEN